MLTSRMQSCIYRYHIAISGELSPLIFFVWSLFMDTTAGVDNVEDIHLSNAQVALKLHKEAGRTVRDCSSPKM